MSKKRLFATSRRGSSGLFIALGAVLFLSACPDSGYTQLYSTKPIAPSFDETEVREFDRLGATLVDDGINFSVFSGNAERVDVLLFDDPESSTPVRQFEMERFGDIWNIFVSGVGEGQHYGYIAWGPNWEVHPDWFPGSTAGFVMDVDAAGHRYNPNKLLLDPYTRAVHRDHDWGRGSVATGPMRHESTWGAAAKSVVTKSHYEWSENEAEWREARQNRDLEGHRFNDPIVYEVHPKGFTADEASGVGLGYAGTFKGFAEKAEYLVDLGVTAVELMPIMEKPLDGGYWGYNNLLFFAPEHTYAYDRRPGRVLDEFKGLVDVLHQHGLEVYLDVVHNHTGEGGHWRHKLEQSDIDLDPRITELHDFDEREVVNLYSYRGLDNVSYYALEDHDRGVYVNNTGVGNQTRANYRPMRRLILDNLRFWVDEIGIDGFRFDLAPIYGEKDRDYSQWADLSDNLIQDILDDPVMQENNVRLIAEPWSITMFAQGWFPASSNDPDYAWYEWNAHFKNVWRSFLNYDHTSLNDEVGGVDIGGAMTGSHNVFGWNRDPHHAVNYIISHDGFTMYDLFTYPEKQNGCSPLNPACCDGQRHTAFCDMDSGEDYNRSRNWGSEVMKRQMMRNAFAAIMLSQGTPMIYAGDEWMRTQLGNNNAYTPRADNPFNWLQWGTYRSQPQRVRMHDYVRNLIQLRKDRSYAFAPDCYEDRAPFAWKDANNNDAEGHVWNGRHIAKHYYDSSAGPELFVIINMEEHDVSFSLPEGRTWNRLLDTQQWFDDQPFFEQEEADDSRTHNVTLDDPPMITDANYVASPRTFVVLEAAQ